MSASFVLKGSPTVWEPPPAQPLDEVVWQQWLAKGLARDQRGAAARMKAVSLVSIVVLLVTSVGSWSHFTLYDTVVRFIVAGGAIVAMFHALRARHYVIAAVLGAIALLYNPAVPVFSFSGDWTRALLAASAVPFAVPLVWRKLRSQTK